MILYLEALERTGDLWITEIDGKILRGGEEVFERARRVGSLKPVYSLHYTKPAEGPARLEVREYNLHLPLPEGLTEGEKQKVEPYWGIRSLSLPEPVINSIIELTSPEYRETKHE